MAWHYEGKEYELPKDYDHKDVYGFVYLITNRATGRMYVGKKFFWSKKTLPITNYNGIIQIRLGGNAVKNLK